MCFHVVKCSPLPVFQRGRQPGGHSRERQSFRLERASPQIPVDRIIPSADIALFAALLPGSLYNPSVCGNIAFLPDKDYLRIHAKATQ